MNQMNQTSIALSTATAALFGKAKGTIAEIRTAMPQLVSIVVALRDNGPKINGTLVFIASETQSTDQNVLMVGDTFSAHNGQNKRPYGTHLVLAVLNGSLEGDSDINLDDLAAAIFIPEAKVTFKTPKISKVVAVEVPEVQEAIDAAEAIEA